jgi:decaprenylphospho-beta-D-ribofuranose 2-oxidase
VVIQLGGEEMSRIGAPQHDRHGYHVTLGAAAKWGDVIPRLAKDGLVPYSVVTTAHATVGGTVSADCLSRSSPLTGREAKHVRSFKMLTVDGRTIDCRKNDPDRTKALLFRAVIGGFGYLGVLTEVTLDLRPPPPGWKPGHELRVATRCDKLIIGGSHGEPWSGLLASLRERCAAADLTADDPSILQRIFPAPAPAAASGVADWDAVSSAAWFAFGRIEALLFRSRYVFDRELRPLPIYQPSSKLMDYLAMATVIPALAEIGEGALYALHAAGVYVDDLSDFTFFMEHQIGPAKIMAAAAGWQLDTVQQTFVLPALPSRPGDPDGTGPTRRFLEQLRPVLFADSVLPALLEPMRPTLIDVLYLPADDFVLSATRDLAGYAVTLSFAERNRAGWDTLQERLRALSLVCQQLGGRVHLIKDVVADQPVLAAMYGSAFAEFLALKRHYDPRGLLENGFFDRVFGRGGGELGDEGPYVVR